MKKIMVWEVDSSGDESPRINQLDIVDQTKTEESLEEVLVCCPDLLLKDLKLVGRQTDTPGGPLDLLGVDSDGQLVVFELKRGNLTRDAVAQVLDYASFLSELDPEELADHIEERSGKLGIDKIEDFLAWYQEQFAESLTRLKKPRMILVGLGVDDRTSRMVSFLADSGADISLITFHGFREGNKTLLAKQVEVEAKPPAGAPSVTKRDNLKSLRGRVANLGLDEHYYEIARFFRRQLSAYQWPNKTGFSYTLPDVTESGTQSNRVYVSLYLSDDRPRETRVQIYSRAIEAASGAFDIAQQALGGRIQPRSDGGADIWIEPAKDWNDVAPVFEELCSAIVEGRRIKQEKQVSSESQPADGDEGELDDV